MKSFEIKLKNSLSSNTSSYAKKFGGILTKIVTCKSEEDLKNIPNYNNIVSIKEL